MTPEEKKVFEQMRQALEDLADAGAEAWTEERPCVRIARAALAAANAVSEPKVKLIPTAQEMGAPMQPQAQYPDQWAAFLHYPYCWDTAAYPTLYSAIHEALAWAGCSVCAQQPQECKDCGQSTKQDLMHTCSPQVSWPKWRPIETAPRDGTLVDLFHKQGWRNPEQWWDGSDSVWVPDVRGDEQYSHWMPLPPAPGAA